MPERIKAPSTKEDLLIIIQESWNHFDKEYCFKLLKSMPERNKSVIKTLEGTTKYSNFLVNESQNVFLKMNWEVPIP